MKIHVNHHHEPGFYPCQSSQVIHFPYLVPGCSDRLGSTRSNDSLDDAWRLGLRLCRVTRRFIGYMSAYVEAVISYRYMMVYVLFGNHLTAHLYFYTLLLININLENSNCLVETNLPTHLPGSMLIYWRVSYWHTYSLVMCCSLLLKVANDSWFTR